MVDTRGGQRLQQFGAPDGAGEAEHRRRPELDLAECQRDRAVGSLDLAELADGEVEPPRRGRGLDADFGRRLRLLVATAERDGATQHEHDRSHDSPPVPGMK
jgi:hypothetical protein